MKKIRKLSKKLAMPMTAMFVLAGCQNVAEYRNERITKADKAFKEIKSKTIPKNAILSLPYCIETALTNNLNMRVFDLKVAMNNEKRTAAALGMLPDVMITNDISIRNNEPGASSYSLLTGNQSLQPSQSSEKWDNRVRVEFLFSFIDFGLAYFNAVQAKDRAIITQEEKRRAAQNLILDVSRSYFKVASAQYAMENTQEMLMIADETERLLEQMVKDKKLPLEKIITEKKTFLILKKSLMEYKRSYKNSCIELRALMGYYPTNELSVDTSGMRVLADLKIPDIELLEEIALIERPELYQLDIQQHITAISAKKKIIEMFPNVGIFTDFTNSTNKYLYNQSWWELGARAAYRLLRVPQQIGEFAAIETEIDQIKAQVIALSVGILSQVRIAHANLMEVKGRYQLAEELYDAYLKHEELKEKQAKNSGAVSMIELNRIKMETAQKDIERSQALGNYYLAYFRLLNSVGLETLDSKTLEDAKSRIHDNFKSTQEEELESITEYKECITEFQKQLDELTRNKDVLSNKIATIQSSKTDNEDLQNLKKEVKEYSEQIEGIEKDKAAVEGMLKQSEDSLNNHRAKLERYVAAIELLNNKERLPSSLLQDSLKVREAVDKAVPLLSDKQVVKAQKLDTVGVAVSEADQLYVAVNDKEEDHDQAAGVDNPTEILKSEASVAEDNRGGKPKLDKKAAIEEKSEKATEKPVIKGKAITVDRLERKESREKDVAVVSNDTGQTLSEPADTDEGAKSAGIEVSSDSDKKILKTPTLNNEEKRNDNFTDAISDKADIVVLKNEESKIDKTDIEKPVVLVAKRKQAPMEDNVTEITKSSAEEGLQPEEKDNVSDKDFYVGVMSRNESNDNRYFNTDSNDTDIFKYKKIEIVPAKAEENSNARAKLSNVSIIKPKELENIQNSKVSETVNGAKNTDLMEDKEALEAAKDDLDPEYSNGEKVPEKQKYIEIIPVVDEDSEYFTVRKSDKEKNAVKESRDNKYIEIIPVVDEDSEYYKVKKGEKPDRISEMSGEPQYIAIVPGSIEDSGGYYTEKIQNTSNEHQYIDIVPEDNLNMETQEQAIGNKDISFLEYDPNATNNIDVETQNNSKDNNITLMGYNPETQNDIQIQTLNNADNSDINFQEYGSELETGDESIGNVSKNQSIDAQLNKKLTD